MCCAFAELFVDLSIKYTEATREIKAVTIYTYKGFNKVKITGEKVSVSIHLSHQSVVRSCSNMDIGHWAKTLFALASIAFGVGSDVMAGLSFYNPQNVTRFFENSTLAPDYCVPCLLYTSPSPRDS